MNSVYTHFTAQHFRLFESISVQFSPVTIISGKNNTGKTALLEALFLHASGPRAGGNALAVLNPARSSIPLIMTQTEDRTIWDSLFYNNETQTPVSLAGRYDNLSATVELSPLAESIVAPATVSGSGGTTSGESYAQSVKVVFISDGEENEYVQTATQQMYNQQTSGPISLQLGGISLRLTPPAEPFLAANIVTARTRSNHAEIAQRYSDLRVLGRQRNFLEALKGIDPRLGGMEVLVRDGQPTLHFSIAGQQLMPLTFFGEGMVAAVDILSIIYAKKSRVVMIDEIENGIHYTVLQDLWWHIKRAARATNTQVIATTHSRECIAAAQKAFEKDGKQMLRLLRLWRKSSDADVSVTAYDFRDIESALDLNLDVR